MSVPLGDYSEPQDRVEELWSLSVIYRQSNFVLDLLCQTTFCPLLSGGMVHGHTREVLTRIV